jgi:hypothetical protein
LSSRNGWDKAIKVRIPNFAMKLLKSFFQRIPRHYLVNNISESYDRSLLFTDASLSGWGAHINSVTYGGLWSKSDASEHISFLELKCVRLVLQKIAKDLCGQRVLLFTDNQTVMYIIQNWYSRNRKLRLEVQRIIDILRINKVDLAALYINTTENVLADALSRVVQEHLVVVEEMFLNDFKCAFGIEKVI